MKRIFARIVGMYRQFDAYICNAYSDKITNQWLINEGFVNRDNEWHKESVYLTLNSVDQTYTYRDSRNIIYGIQYKSEFYALAAFCDESLQYTQQAQKDEK